MSKILVAYGSLTGNTQMVAERIADHCKTQGHVVTLQNIGELVPTDLIMYEVLILGSSTWDDGQLQMDTQTLVDLWNHSPVELAHTHYAVFGCGDSSYSTFCVAVNTLSDLLNKAGSKQLVAGLKIDGFPEMTENVTAIEQWNFQLTDLLKTP